MEPPSKNLTVEAVADFELVLVLVADKLVVVLVALVVPCSTLMIGSINRPPSTTPVSSVVPLCKIVPLEAVTATVVLGANATLLNV